MTIDQMGTVGNHFAKIPTIKRIEMMNEKLNKPNWFKISSALIGSLMIVVVLACNDKLVTVVKSTEIGGVLPAGAQLAMDELKEKYPNENFVYVEIDNQFQNQKGGNQTYQRALQENDINKNSVRFVMGVKERSKLGLILSTSGNLDRIADLSKDTSTSSNEIFDIVEDQPEPVGGMAAFYG